MLHVDTSGGNRGSVDVALDSVTLDGTQSGAFVRRQQCDCDALFLDASLGNQPASGSIEGTVYLPSADVRLDFGRAPAFHLTRGLVTRTLTLDNLPNDPNDPNYAPIALPDGGIYSDRVVAFEAFLGPKTTPTLRARVLYCDSDPPEATDPEFGRHPACAKGDPPQIVSWDPHP